MPHPNSPPTRKRNKIDDAVRERIINAVVDRGLEIHDVANLFDYPPSTIRSIVSTFQRTGRTTKLPRGGNRGGVIEPQHTAWLAARLDERPDHTVLSLQTDLNKHFRIVPPVSLASVTRAVRKLMGYTLKLMRVEPDRCNEPPHVETRRQWANTILKTHHNMSDFVYLDEASFSLHIHRKFGRAPVDIRLVQRVPTNKRPNMSLLVAIDKTGVVASHFKPGSFKSIDFAAFLTNRLFPALEGPRVLILDNARIHKTDLIRRTVANAGHTLLFLPPHSPHLNAAESVFGCAKAHVKKQEVQRDTLSGHVERDLARITARMAQGWICEVGRNFSLSVKGELLGRLNNVNYTREPMEDPYVEHFDDETNVADDEAEGMDKNEDWVEDVEEEEEEERVLLEVEPTPPPVPENRRARLSPTRRTRSGAPYGKGRNWDTLKCC